jgi:uncharacterized membrane protein
MLSPSLLRTPFAGVRTIVRDHGTSRAPGGRGIMPRPLAFLKARMTTAKPVASDADAKHPRCAICAGPAKQPLALGAIRPSIAALILAEHPSLRNGDLICRRHVTDYRMRHVADMLERERGEISDLEKQVVESLANEETISRNIEETWEDQRTVGERMADQVAEFGGSWKFIISFTLVLLSWIALNAWVIAGAPFDPYPFILLNLVLSCLAAIQAPIIMMSQKRQEAKDRLRSENDYRVNLKAELEIRHLHEKVDHLINRQWERLAEIQQIQLEIMEELASRRG